MAGSDRWYFSKEVLANTPSRRCGIDADKELSYRQQAANLIQDMGQRLHVSQLCINTAIVYMHRFYTFHSFTKYHRNSISSCALFLAAKVEEQPRKLEHVIKVSHMCLHRETPAIDVKSEAYQDQAMELVFNENLMLQTLGFDIAVEHPHTSVVNCCQLVRASKDLAQTSYFMATNSLHLTTMSLQYKPTVVACVCIHLACKWSSWEIPRSSEGKDWFFYVDKTVTLELLERLTSEFLAILDKCPSRLKRKIMAGSGGNASAANAVSLNKSNDEKKIGSHMKEDIKPSIVSKSSSQPPETTAPTSPLMKKIKSEPSSQPSNKIPVAMSYAAYRERKERDSKLEQSVKSNQLVKSLLPSATRESLPQQRERPIVEKMNLKQQQINIDKQKQIDERNKLKAKNPDFLWDNSSGRQTLSKPISSSSHQKCSQNNVTNEDFYDNLLNKPSNFNSIFSTDGEDSLEFKKDITTDLKMEFSDNSNLSNDALNLSSFPSDFINDSSDSKKSLNISYNNNNNNNSNNKFQTNIETKPTSFMSIFSSPITTANPSITQTVPSKLDNTTANIPMKYNTNDFQNMLSRLKPEPPPPMLSPLKSGVEIETVNKPEKQSFPTHPSVATHLKSNMNSNQNFDSKQISNLKSSKTPPKNRNPIPTKHSMGTSFQTSPKEKEVIESSQNINLDKNTNQTTLESQTVVNINNCSNNNNFNSNDLINSSESMPSIAIKQENIEKPLKGAEVPSVLSQNRAQMSSTSNQELDIKPNIDFIPNMKPTLHLSPPQKPTNNNSLITDQSSSAAKGMVAHKDSKEKGQEEKHSEKHHKHSHHSHKSSKHKDKHKHKHKDKDREKHKRKDKDRDRERDREKPNEVKEDPSYKLCWSSPKSKSEVSNNPNIAPIKLKISKKKLSVDSPDKDNDVPQNPLKLRIQLKDQKLTTSASDFDLNDSSSGRKRKSSPKSSKKEKVSKYETEFNNKMKDEKSSKSSKSSKKSNDSSNSKKNSNLISDDRYSTQPINSFGHQMLNLGIGQTMGAPQDVVPTRSSKAHK